MTDTIAMEVAEYADGAHGELEEHEQIDALANVLFDFCNSRFGGIYNRLDDETMSSVQRLVATAMLRQHHYEEEMWGEVM
jgi:hypothetical protein